MMDVYIPYGCGKRRVFTQVARCSILEASLTAKQAFLAHAKSRAYTGQSGGDSNLIDMPAFPPPMRRSPFHGTPHKRCCFQ
ncbi:uncharacterized protein BYT42DRAFT_568615 [Radiomyces spectabilis]|uniref:uncharacterized protein n=1 Tax=Radiomyces spectabilis TaxID=64574 RepID=UPI002220F006|nr:uncharacterized protein BYT42DRAFT_568615 [Radiomyces spectabilis]KAI8379387.1 hypothetical protein BYT42DRAFT_568615 [Radiomyces spectabilis]